MVLLSAAVPAFLLQKCMHSTVHLSCLQVLGDLPPKRAPAVLQAAGITADDSRKETGYILGDSIVVVDAEVGVWNPPWAF